MLRSIGVALLALLTIILLRTRGRTHAIHSAAWLASSVGAFLLTSMPGAQASLGALVYPLTALCSTHPVWFWICSRALFTDGPSLRTSHVVCLGVMAVGGVVYQSALPQEASDAETAVRILGVAFGASSLLFACLAPLTVFLGIAGDLDARRRQVRRWFVPIVSLYLAAVALTQMLFQGRATPTSLVLLNLVVIDAVAALAVSSFVRLRIVNWLAALDAGPPVALTRLEQSVLDRLNRRFASERLYAREALSIAELASILGTQEHVLRRVINHGLGFRNFSDFLHYHRLKEAAERLSDPELRRIPVLTIALEAGYGSIGPFNRAFKERFDMTPTEYRRTPAVHADLPDPGVVHR